MKKLLLNLFLLASTTPLLAQVAIGNDSPQSSAILDVDVSQLTSNAKKGMLYPKIQLLSNTDVLTVPTPAEGLVVYNLANAGTGTTQVYANMLYFWNGTKWNEITTMDVVREQLLPQVFLLQSGAEQTFVASTINAGTAQQVTYDTADIRLNTGNRVTLNNNEFNVNTTGKYEISGSINFNPNMINTSTANVTNLEFIFQVQSSGSMAWNDVAKSIITWGYGTGVNNRTSLIAPVVVSLNQDDKLRFMIQKTKGNNIGTNTSDGVPKISSPTALYLSKLLKIQKLD